jgi:thiamine biosynthesis lipoprotein
MKRFFLIILLLNLVGCTQSYFQASSVVFGTNFTLSVSLLGKDSKKAFNEMIERIYEIDQEISPTNQNSKVYYFNNVLDINEKMLISFDMYTMVNTAIYYNQKYGLFNICVQPIANIWKVDILGMNLYKGQTITNEFDLPNIEYLNSMNELINNDHIALTVIDDLYYIEKDLKDITIDLGGIAKGYSTDLCKDIVSKYKLKSALLDISGNIYLYGDYYKSNQKKDWKVGVINPRPIKTPFRDNLLSFNIKGNTSIVTSGDYERYYNYNAIPVSHIIDPRTLMPKGIYYNNEYKYNQKSLISVTVISPNSMLNDIFSTSLILLDLDEAKEILIENNLQGIIMNEESIMLVGDIVLTNDYNEYKNYELK